MNNGKPINKEKYSTRTIMFPKNHNDVIKVVIGEYDRKLNKGVSMIEVNVLSSYIPQQFTHYQEHKTFDEVISRVKELVTMVDEENQKKPIRDMFESENTFIVTAITKNGARAENVKFPSSPINILEDKGQTQVSIYGSCTMKMKKHTYMCIEVTNDPTPMIAGAVVSLGYYTWRIEMRNVKLTSVSPLTQILCKSEDVKYSLCRPCRRPI